jgi:hypothetical protein
VVVDDFDIEWLTTTTGPLEANAPLVVDPDAVLSRPITTELLEVVSRQVPKVYEACGLINAVESDIRSPSRYSRESSNMLTVRELFGIAITELWWH